MASNQLANLVIKIGANASEFSKNLKEVESSASASSKKLADLQRNQKIKILELNRKEALQAEGLSKDKKRILKSEFDLKRELVKQNFDNEKRAIESLEKEENRRFERTKKRAKIIAAAFAAIGSATVIASVNQFIQLEDALIGVQKTTDIAGQEFEDLKKSITSLSRDLAVSREELLGITQTAGQLGVRGVENLTKFTETIAKLSLASADLKGEAAATELARILNVTGEGFTNVDRFASVLARLGDDVAATEGEIVRLANEVARSTSIFNVNASQAAALGASLKSVGVQAELGGSAVGRTFRAIDEAINEGGQAFQDLQDVTGLTGDQLRKTFKEDSVEVFKVFAEGLGSIIKQGGDSTAVLERFGLKGEEILKVLPPLAKRSDIISRSLALQADEYERNTKLQEEFEKRSKSTSFQIDRAKVAVEGLAETFGELFAPSVRFFAGLFSDAVNFIAARIDILKIRLEQFGSEFRFLVNVVTAAVVKIDAELERFVARVSLNLSTFFSDLARISPFLQDQLNAFSDSLEDAALRGAEAANKAQRTSDLLVDQARQRRAFLIKQQEEANKRIAALEEAQTDKISQESQKRLGIKASEQEQSLQSEVDSVQRKFAILDQIEQERLEKKREEEEELRQEKLDREQEQFEEDLELLDHRLELAREAENFSLQESIKQERDALIAKAKLRGVDVKRAERDANSRVDIEKNLTDATLKELMNVFDAKTAVGRALFLFDKGRAIANAVMSTHVAVTNALQDLPHPKNYIFAALTAAKGFAEVASIKQQAFSAQQGGVVPGGFGGGDRVPMLLEPGEIIIPNQIRPTFDELLRNGGTGGGTSTHVIVGFEEDAARYITLKQREDRALGVQR